MTKLEKKQSLLNRAYKLEKIVIKTDKFTNRSAKILLKAQNLRSKARQTF